MGMSDVEEELPEEEATYADAVDEELLRSIADEYEDDEVVYDQEGNPRVLTSDRSFSRSSHSPGSNFSHNASLESIEDECNLVEKLLAEKVIERWFALVVRRRGTAKQKYIKDLSRDVDSGPKAHIHASEVVDRCPAEPEAPRSPAAASVGSFVGQEQPGTVKLSQVDDAVLPQDNDGRTTPLGSVSDNLSSIGTPVALVPPDESGFPKTKRRMSDIGEDLWRSGSSDLEDILEDIHAVQDKLRLEKGQMEKQRQAASAPPEVTSTPPPDIEDHSTQLDNAKGAEVEVVHRPSASGPNSLVLPKTDQPPVHEPSPAHSAAAWVAPTELKPPAARAQARVPPAAARYFRNSRHDSKATDAMQPNHPPPPRQPSVGSIVPSAVHLSSRPAAAAAVAAPKLASAIPKSAVAAPRLAAVTVPNSTAAAVPNSAAVVPKSAAAAPKPAPKLIAAAATNSVPPSKPAAMVTKLAAAAVPNSAAAVATSAVAAPKSAVAVVASRADSAVQASKSSSAAPSAFHSASHMPTKPAAPIFSSAPHGVPPRLAAAMPAQPASQLGAAHERRNMARQTAARRAKSQDEDRNRERYSRADLPPKIAAGQRRPAGMAAGQRKTAVVRKSLPAATHGLYVPPEPRKYYERRHFAVADNLAGVLKPT